jgi:hypothetical protein
MKESLTLYEDCLIPYRLMVNLGEEKYFLIRYDKEVDWNTGVTKTEKLPR